MLCTYAYMDFATRMLLRQAPRASWFTFRRSSVNVRSCCWLLRCTSRFLDSCWHIVQTTCLWSCTFRTQLLSCSWSKQDLAATLLSHHGERRRVIPSSHRFLLRTLDLSFPYPHWQGILLVVLSLPVTACSRMESTCSRTCNTEPLHEGMSFPIPPWRTWALQQKEPHADEPRRLAKEYTAALQHATENIQDRSHSQRPGKDAWRKEYISQRWCPTLASGQRRSLGLTQMPTR